MGRVKQLSESWQKAMYPVGLYGGWAGLLIVVIMAQPSLRYWA